jgi:hypothetical protein
MCLLAVFLVLTAALFGAGVALHALWWVVLALVVVWLLGLVFRPRRFRRY